MRTVMRAVLALGSVGAVALAMSVPVRAQDYYPQPRDYDARDYDGPRGYDGAQEHEGPPEITMGAEIAI